MHTQITQNERLGLVEEEEEDLAFAKSTRSLKRASSGFACLVGVGRLLREIF
jgi:hypothetical protein